jgi:copper resistance protein D
VQLAKLGTHAWLLAKASQSWPFPDYVYMLQCQAGLSRAPLAEGLGMAGVRLERCPRALLPWAVIGLAAVLLGADAAWMSHAVGRSEERAFLMTITALHQLAVALACGHWLELRLTPLAGRLAGVVSVLALLLIGLILLFYRENPL